VTYIKIITYPTLIMHYGFSILDEAEASNSTSIPLVPHSCAHQRRTDDPPRRGIVFELHLIFRLLHLASQKIEFVSQDFEQVTGNAGGAELCSSLTGACQTGA
jgi:hypothetical protein